MQDIKAALSSVFLAAELSEKEEKFVGSLTTTADYWWVMQEGSYPTYREFVNRINAKVDEVGVPADCFFCD